MSRVRLRGQRRWDCRLSGTEPGTLGQRGHSELASLVKAHKNAQSQMHPSTRTKSVWLKNMIKKKKLFGTAIYKSTHAEHLCPPAVDVLLWFILFSSLMIMISLVVKYKCKFRSLFPDTLGKKPSLYSFSRRRGTFLKENILKRRHYQFHFCHPPDSVILSPICFSAALCMWTHQHQEHP